MDYKKCNKCLEIKPITDFNKHSNSKDKLRYNCRQCQSNIKSMWKKITEVILINIKEKNFPITITIAFPKTFHKRMTYAKE